MMRIVPLLVAASVAAISVPAAAQDTSAPASTAATAASTDQTMTEASTTDNSGPRAPDGSRAFGLVPYVGVSGGWEQFDNERNNAGIPQTLNGNGTVRRGYKLAGAIVEGVAGVNLPLGPVFVGVEGNVAKGVSGDIDWEYGGAGRFGFRAGDSGLFYGKVGYEWVNFERFGNNSPDYHDMTYGIGFEVGPKDIGLSGLTNRAGFRLKGEVSTFGDAHSIRPTLGIVTHF